MMNLFETAAQWPSTPGYCGRSRLQQVRAAATPQPCVLPGLSAPSTITQGSTYWSATWNEHKMLPS